VRNSTTQQPPCIMLSCLLGCEVGGMGCSSVNGTHQMWYMGRAIVFRWRWVSDKNNFMQIPLDSTDYPVWGCNSVLNPYNWVITQAIRLNVTYPGLSGEARSPHGLSGLEDDVGKRVHWACQCWQTAWVSDIDIPGLTHSLLGPTNWATAWAM